LTAEKNVTEQKQPSQELKGGTETILVVEDEAPLLRVVCAALERFGYRVVAAESAVIALRMWHESQSDIDMVLTDIVMPDGLTGHELASILRSESPELPIILTTGYTDRVITDVEGPNLHFLRKPYDLQKLLRLVRESLDQRGSTTKARELNPGVRMLT
jgi:two-component system cell cycle sensor histidine kinase/response regulator CckA